MRVFVLIGQLIFAKLPFCAGPGAVVGALAGFVSALALLGQMLPTTPQNVVVMGLLCGLLGFVFILVVYGIWLRYGVGVIFWPALLNALTTSILTVGSNNLLKLPAIAGWLGLLIGILVGSILCRWCRNSDPYRGKRHA